MTDWQAIIQDELTEAEREHLARFMAEADGRDPGDEGYVVIHDAGGWTWPLDGAPATPEQTASFLESLVELRDLMNRRRGWLHIIRLVFGDAAGKVVAIIERETGVSTEEALPVHLDPDEPEGVAVFEAEEAEHRATMERLAERRRVELETRAARATGVAAEEEARRARRRPVPVKVADPSRQLALVFTDVPYGPAPQRMKRLPLDYMVEVTELMRAWLAGRSTPITRFLATGLRSYTVNGVRHQDLWAHVRLVEGKRALVIFVKRRGIDGAPGIIYRGGDLHYDWESERWTYADVDSTVDEHTRAPG